jgi:class 3 adenylate cyclase/CHASE2 domain-containing sensor protein
VARPASAKPTPFRRARLGVASLIALALGALTAAVIHLTDAGQTLDLMVSDHLRSANPLPDAPAANPVLTVEIDDNAVRHSEGGRWAPWPRPKQAAFVDALASLGPRLIVLDIEYADAEEKCVAFRTRIDGSREAYIVHQPDDRFRDSLARAGNVVVPFSLYLHGRAGTTAEGAAPAPPEVQAYVRGHALDPSPPATIPLLEAERLNPMIPPLADVAVGSGFTSIPKKDPDQAIRRIPLLARAGAYVFPHLGLEMAGLQRFGPEYHVWLQDDRLILTSADRSLSVGVPVGPKAELNLRWPTDLAAVRRSSISAAPVLDLVRDRRRLAALDRRWRLLMEDLASLFPDVGWAEARAALDAAIHAVDDAQTAEGETVDVDTADVTAVDLAQNPAAAPPNLVPLRQRLDRVEERLVMTLMTAAARAADADDADPTARQAATAVDRHQEFITTYHAIREKQVADVRRGADALRPRVADKTVIVGLSVTAGTDLHKTPISNQQPGVEVYPAVMRTILSGVAFRRLGDWADWLVTILAAWLVGILAVRLPTGWAVAAAVWVTVGVLIGAYLAAGTAALLLPVAGPVLAGVVAFAGASGYRQLTEARSRRWITRVFEQYTSPAHVEEIIGNPDALRLGGERREITVLFSDIAGFTPLSERMDPERLVALLQHYLGAMTAILYAERATLDKYEGDGIMAFVGAPVQVDDHALRAVRAALAMQNAMPEINADLVRMGLLEDGARLRIRVGCSSGPANVGNFGSETRFDYTAMGDTVNLGGRLEEANRWLGTRILVPVSTREACGEAVLFREMGLARIRGKTEPVRLFEPLALAPAPDPLRTLAEAFGRAVRALEAGDVDAAEAALADLLAAHPDDAPADALRDRIQAVRDGRLEVRAPWNLARPKEEAGVPDAH